MSEEELPTAAIAEYCENCGTIELIYATQELSKPEKKPCEDNQIEDQELVRRQDVLEKLSSHVDECERQIKLIENNELDLENPDDVKEFWKEHKSLLQGMIEDFSTDNEKKNGDSE